MTATVREATADDNDALVELTDACPMEGDIGLAVDRAPDYFAFNRLEGTAWKVGVVDGPDGRPVGCIAVAERPVYVTGEARPATYLSDLRVQPAHRGRGAADALLLWARDACLASHGADGVAFLTMLAGNRSMMGRMEGPRGTPVIERVTTFRTHTIPLLWRRRGGRDDSVGITAATEGDVPEMAALWSQLAPARQFADVHDAASLARWIDAAPGLTLDRYRLARGADGSLAGFLGVWDQSSFKRLRVTGYSRRLAAARMAFNAVAPLAHGTTLPAPGGALRNLTAVHVCAAPSAPDVLRALLLDAYDANHAGGYSFLNVGFDLADPLAAAVRGLLAQPTDVWVCVMRLRTAAPALDGRPSQPELALM